MIDHDVPESPLAGIRYQQRATDLVRYVDDPVDDAIAAVVERCLRAPDAELAVFRKALIDDESTLRLFSRRRAAAALRLGSLPLAEQAALCLVMVDRSRMDYRDFSPDFALYAIKELGGDLDAIGRKALAMAEPSTGECIARRAELTKSWSLASCALRRTVTTYGVGFIRGLPRAHQPTCNVPAVAVKIADATPGSVAGCC